MTSIGWHIFAGCSDPKVMDTAARIDYLGIGWLISASIATVVYYGFSCRPYPFTIYLGMTIVAGLAGSVLPFMQWFNQRKHKKWRIVFFLSLALTAFIPIMHLCFIHGAKEAIRYIWPIAPSEASYVFGLLFYAFHFPECLWATEGGEHGDHSHERNLLDKSSRSQLHQHQHHHWHKARWTNWIGGGSHAIWHISIVVAIWLHRSAITALSEGLSGEICDPWNRV
jgi:adiponectin receptor